MSRRPKRNNNSKLLPTKHLIPSSKKHNPLSKNNNTMNKPPPKTNLNPNLFPMLIYKLKMHKNLHQISSRMLKLIKNHKLNTKSSTKKQLLNLNPLNHKKPKTKINHQKWSNRLIQFKLLYPKNRLKKNRNWNKLRHQKILKRKLKRTSYKNLN